MGRRGRDGALYRRLSAEFRTGLYLCHLCGQAPGTEVDHVPPLASFADPTEWVGELRPACPPCNRSAGARFGNRRRSNGGRGPDYRPSRDWYGDRA